MCKCTNFPDRRDSDCVACQGDSICSHGKRYFYCDVCPGERKGYCSHGENRLIARCKECKKLGYGGGRSLCPCLKRWERCEKHKSVHLRDRRDMCNSLDVLLRAADPERLDEIFKRALEFVDVTNPPERPFDASHHPQFHSISFTLYFDMIPVSSS